MDSREVGWRHLKFVYSGKACRGGHGCRRADARIIAVAQTPVRRGQTPVRRGATRLRCRPAVLSVAARLECDADPATPWVAGFAAGFGQHANQPPLARAGIGPGLPPSGRLAVSAGRASDGRPRRAAGPAHADPGKPDTRTRTAVTGGPFRLYPRPFRPPACDAAHTVCCRPDHAGKPDTTDRRCPGECRADPRSPSRRWRPRPCARRRLVPGSPW